MPSSAPSHLPEQRILEQSVRLPTSGAVTAWAACRWWGATFFDGTEPDGRTPIPVPLAIGPRGKMRPDGAASVSLERLDQSEIVTRHGLRITSRERATFDEMRRTDDLRRAVEAIDMMAAAEQTSVVRMVRYVEQRRGWQRVALVREALSLASEHSWSPTETRLRLIWILDARLPPPLVNCPILDPSGKLLGIADLLDPEAGLVVEYDGADHRGASRHRKDVVKEHRLRQVGLEVTRVTGPDLSTPSAVVSRLLEARSRSRFEARADRRWLSHPRADVLEGRLHEREEREIWLRQPLPDLRELRRW